MTKLINVNNENNDILTTRAVRLTKTIQDNVLVKKPINNHFYHKH